MQLGKTHLGIERIRTGKTAGQHGIGTAGEQFVDGELDRVKGRGTGGIKGIAGSSQAQRFG